MFADEGELCISNPCDFRSGPRGEIEKSNQALVTVNIASVISICDCK